MTEPAKIDRKHVQLRIGDLLPGESGSISTHVVQVDSDMSVWLDGNALVDNEFDLGVVRRDDGYHLVLASEEQQLSRSTRGLMSGFRIPVVEIHVAEPKGRA
ncbi:MULTISPECIES: hypothetical protein [Nocardia]|uniref:hypothetical protein n=1 Tax=Nocardia TaxID=1817 RepID=UPI000D698ACC|nr:MULTISPECIES: hypothetical protein [Nocardia]